MKFSDIPQLTPDGGYEINMPLDMLEKRIVDWESDPHYMLQISPDFQRGHIWTEAQQTAYVEYFLRGGRTGMVIYFNKPDWRTSPQTDYNDFVCVDGLQRLTALRRFLKGEIPAFGQYYDDFGQSIHMARHSDSLRLNINSLQTREQVLTWYLQMNAGGTPHTAEEIARVRQLLEAEKAGAAPTITQKGGAS